MVTKKKNPDETEKKGRVRVGKLKLDKQTVRDLRDSDLKKVKGGALPPTTQQGDCEDTLRICH